MTTCLHALNRPESIVSIRMPRLRLLALGLALAWAALPVPASGRDDAGTAAAWNSALHDGRLRNVRLLDADQRRALAREYGLENLLPDRPGGTTVGVTSCADSGAGSLRDAIASAPSGAIIDASALTCASITLGTGEIDIPQQDLTIIGPGREALTIAPKYGRVFSHGGGGMLTISGLSVTGGSVSGVYKAYGGCIYSAGSIALGNLLYASDRSTGVTVSGCRAVGDVQGAGGAVFAASLLSLTNTIVSNSEATSNAISSGGGLFARGLSMKYCEIHDNMSSAPSGYGGGAYVFGVGHDMLIDSSTFAGNAAYDTGGAFFGGAVYDQDFEIRNSTVSGNAAHSNAGIAVRQGSEDASTSIYNSTITANVASGYDTGSGVSVHSRGIALESSIISGNFKGTSLADDLDTSYCDHVYGHDNIVGVVIGNVPSDTRIGINPLLGPLTNNGGRSRTHALLAGSPAIDAGNNDQNLTDDQRGDSFPRVIGAAADIGAVEFDSDVIFRSGFD